MLNLCLGGVLVSVWMMTPKKRLLKTIKIKRCIKYAYNNSWILGTLRKSNTNKRICNAVATSAAAVGSEKELQLLPHRYRCANHAARDLLPLGCLSKVVGGKKGKSSTTFFKQFIFLSKTDETTSDSGLRSRLTEARYRNRPLYQHWHRDKTPS